MKLKKRKDYDTREKIHGRLARAFIKLDCARRQLRQSVGGGFCSEKYVKQSLAIGKKALRASNSGTISLNRAAVIASLLRVMAQGLELAQEYREARRRGRITGHTKTALDRFFR